MCKARFNMQYKYIKQIQELYGEEEIDNDDEVDDVNMNVINEDKKDKNNNKYFISILPLQEEEIRGIDWLKKFGKFLIK